MGLGNPVDPEVCRMQNGSWMALSNVLSYGYTSVVSASRSSSVPGISRTFMAHCCKISSTRGRYGCSQGLTQILHSAALRTAKAASVLFLGERNKACAKEKEKESVVGQPNFGQCSSWYRVTFTHSVAGLGTRVGQQDVSKIISGQSVTTTLNLRLLFPTYEVRYSPLLGPMWVFQPGCGATKRFCQPPWQRCEQIHVEIHPRCLKIPPRSIRCNPGQ